jgi:hypothetical protein
MRGIFLAAVIGFSLVGCAGGSAADVGPDGPTVAISDFEIVEGDEWSGTLTYLDYDTDKRVTIPTRLTVEISSPSTLRYSVSYPEEPWEDTKAKLKVKRSGRTLDGHPVTFREERPDGGIEIRTEYRGKDNNAPATIRITYVLGAKTFTMSKDVQPDGDTAFVNRNVYAFTRP